MLTVVAFVFSIPITLYNVYKAYKANNLNQANLWESSRPLIPLMSLFVITTYWAYYSPSNVLETDPRMFYFMVGTAMSNIAVCIN